MTIDEKILSSLRRALSKNADKVPEGIKDSEWRYGLNCAADTVEWVLKTGRFSGSLVYALNDCRMYDLLRRLTVSAITAENITQDFIYKVLRNYKPLLKHLFQRIGC